MIKLVLIFRKLAACLLVAVLFCLSACKKDKPQQHIAQKNTSLFGQWYTLIKPGEQERHLLFLSDSTFSLVDVEYKNGNSTTVTYNGKFHTKGNGLDIAITKKTTSQSGSVISTEPSDAKFYMNSTFAVDNNKLILDFADNNGAPVNTTFMMILPD